MHPQAATLLVATSVLEPSLRANVPPNVTEHRQLTNVQVNQKGVSAHGDVVAGDKSETHYHAPPAPVGVVETLLQKLQAEVSTNKEVLHTIESLARYYNERSLDGVKGLKNKLDAADRSNEYVDALEKKEMFAKLLEKWALYASAQEIFAHFLAKAEHEFNYIIYPQIGELKPFEVNQLVTDKIVVPTIAECGATVFSINHSAAMGMIYWLAEQCYVRWHQ
jgi:hypothetical protein